MATTKKTKKNPTTAKGWKKSKVSSGPEPLELPSGNTALVRRPGMQSFLTDGLIPNGLIAPMMDTLDGNDPQKQKKAVSTMTSEMLKDPDALKDMITLVDNVTVVCVVEPSVHHVPGEDEDRDPELLYVDEVDLDDKMMVFSYASGGTSDLATFRSGVADSVAALEDGGTLALPPQSTAGD